jgi:hypothetical protein
MEKLTYVISYKQFKCFDNYKLDKITNITTGTKFSENSQFGSKINEIFDKKIITNYSIEKRKSPIFSSDDYIFTFKTNSGIEYRLDLLKHDDDKVSYENMYSVLFSLVENDPWSSDVLNYEKLTNKDEMIEILNRIRYIIEDWLDKTKLNITFVIGKSDNQKKNNIYEYFIRICLPTYNIKYDYSEHYFDNKAFYLYK